MRKLFFGLCIWFVAVIAFVASGLSAMAGEVTIPAVGSRWSSIVEYRSITRLDGEVVSGAGKRSEEVVVVRHEDGVPVFRTKIFGYVGEMYESNLGTVIYSDECKQYIPKEMLTPPAVPNQCAWHVCRAPEDGATFSRPMTVFAELYSCFPRVGVYTFTVTGKGEVNGSVVSIGEAEINFGLLQNKKWQSYISNGRGEVRATSSSSDTTYTEVSVSQSVYMPTIKLSAEDSEPKQLTK